MTRLATLNVSWNQYRELKEELGLDHFERRTYQGWAHHVVLTAVAFTFLQIERGRALVEPRPTLPVVRGWVREIMALLFVVHKVVDSVLTVGADRGPAAPGVL